MNGQFKDKAILIKYLFDMRKKILARDVFGLSNEEKTFCAVLVKQVDALSKDAKEIISNEFIYDKPRDWWISYYSRSTYYRLKGSAMDELLNALKW